MARKSTPLLYNGTSHTIAEWARLRCINEASIRQRLLFGWPVAQALGFEHRPERIKNQNAVIVVRLTAEQHKHVKSAAHRRELSMNQFCVDAIINAAQ